MRLSIVKYSLVVSAWLCCGFLVSGMVGQELAPAIPPEATRQESLPTEEVAAHATFLKRLADRFAERRAGLDRRRQALAREQDLLSTVDQPADKAALALWRQRETMANHLERDLVNLRTLIAALSPEALQAVPLPDGGTGQVLTPDAGLSRTNIDVNLRSVPQAPPFAVLKAGTLVARLATDAGRGWSLVATSQGIGFAPLSQLRREP
ncbi:MAG: hypothetical protein OXC69_08625 [Candidatus Tectomicrobia bacterium]|nr:hypothetical protein [Candidatus Tectomicrobia bacterium]